MIHHSRRRRRLACAAVLLAAIPLTSAQSIALLPTTYNPVGFVTSVYQSIVYVTSVPQVPTVVQTVVAAPPVVQTVVAAPSTIVQTIVAVPPAPTTVVQVVPVVVSTAYLTSAYCLTTLAGWYPAQNAQCPAGAPINCAGAGSALTGYCCAAGTYCQVYAGAKKIKRRNEEGGEEEIETEEDSASGGEWGVELKRGVGNPAIGCCASGKTCNIMLAGANVYTSTVYLVASTAHPAVVVTTVLVAGAANNGQYCSTLTVKGLSGGPTERAGSCGTILVVNEGASTSPKVFFLLSQLCVVVGFMFLVSHAR